MLTYGTKPTKENDHLNKLLTLVSMFDITALHLVTVFQMKDRSHKYELLLSVVLHMSFWE